jgi:hypothetical protein
VILARPLTYMNESGGPVRGLLDYHKLPVDDLVVVHDGALGYAGALDGLAGPDGSLEAAFLDLTGATA